MLCLVQKYNAANDIFTPYICSLMKVDQLFASQNISKNQKILIACSGGVDSMSLLHYLYHEGYSIGAAHCNFQLRPEAQQETDLVSSFCSQRQIPFYVEYFDTYQIAKTSRLSIQECARELRYAFFDRVKHQFHYDWIATAHHANDQIETTIFRLAKGSGLRGLAAMQSKKGTLIRPFLTTTKSEIEQYAAENTVPYLDDASNKKTEYSRNYIRHEVIPIIEKINPEFINTAAANAEQLHFALYYFNKQLDRELRQLTIKNDDQSIISLKALQNKAFAYQLFYEHLKRYHYQGHQIKHIWSLIEQNNSKPSSLYFSTTHSLCITNKAQLIIAPIKQTQIATANKASDKLVIKDQLTIQQKMVHDPVDFDKMNKNQCLVDAQKLQYPLQLRKWQAGDYFYPIGLGKKQKIAKYFNNEKVNHIDRQNAYVLTSGQKIVWLVGYRADDRFKVKEQTEDMLLFEKSKR